jgi:hypothetical protein
MTHEEAIYKSTAYDNLSKCLGYVSNGSDMPVHISQDDATCSYVVRVGNRQYYGNNLSSALEEAAADQKE